MRNTITILFVFLMHLALEVHATSYYLSPNGSDYNSGLSQSTAFATLAHAVSVVNAGDVINVLSGTYYENNSPVIIQTNGTSSSPITVLGDENNMPVFHFNGNESSSNRGIVQDGDYWIWKNVIIENAGDNGMLLSGNNNTINNCVFRYNHDTGLQLSRYSSSASSISQWPTSNKIQNCIAHDNRDSDNEDADGFAAKLTCGRYNVFENCVSHHNIDDGWDLYTKSETGPIGEVTFINCIAHSNGTLSNGSASGSGDKNGFKLGSSSNTVDHLLVRCVAFNNGHHGFTDNGNIGNIKFINLTSYNNSDYNYHTRDNADHDFVNCISYAGRDRIVGNASTSCNALIDDDFNFSYTVSSSDFQTLSPGPDDDPCSNGFLHLSSSSNLIDAGCTSSYLDSYVGSAPDLGAFEYKGTGGGDGTVTLTATAGDGYVNLNWTISNINVNATEVYRDTDPDPTGRTRIASVGLSTSYTDNNVNNGTTYYYWIKVRDTSNNFINSNAASATPSSGGGSGSDEIIEDNDPGLISYDGSLKEYSNANNGYAINLSNDPGKQIVWNYSAPQAGSYSITLRYTRKASMNNKAYIDINGNRVVTLNLSETASGEFTTTSFTAFLNSGLNAIVMETAEDGEFADIDYIQFSLLSTKSTSRDAIPVTEYLLSLDQNCPNPVTGRTTISFVVPVDSQVKLVLTDISGKRVALLIDENMKAGPHSFIFNPRNRNISPGIYIYTLITKNGTISKRMITN
jgi:pectate disaccharide-lyase